MTSIFKMALAATLTLWATAALALDAIGVIKRVSGPAVIERAGARLPATRGTQLQKGDRVVTGAKGHVAITMRGAAMSVGSNASVAVDHFAPDTHQSAHSTIPPILQGLASLLSVNRGR